MAQAKIDRQSLIGGLVASVPVLGQELFVRKGERWINVGQVTMAQYEDGSGKGFCIRATRIKVDHPESVYVKLENPLLAIPLHWS